MLPTSYMLSVATSEEDETLESPLIYNDMITGNQDPVTKYPIVNAVDSSITIKINSNGISTTQTDSHEKPKHNIDSVLVETEAASDGLRICSIFYQKNNAIEDIQDTSSTSIAESFDRNSIKRRQSEKTKSGSFGHKISERNSLLPSSKKSKVSNHFFRCDLCKEKFTGSENYYNHMTIHRKGHCWMCGQCGKEFVTKDDLITHELEQHGEVRPYICPHCVHSFTHSAHLEHHIKNKHYNERSYECNVCKKSFYRSYDLKMHLHIHLGIKPNICDICGKQFSHLSNLFRHQRTHLGMKPYICRTCGRRFLQIQALKVHESSHGGGSCPLCNSHFRSVSSLRTHSKLIHSKSLSFKEAISIINIKGANKFRRYFYCKICGEKYRFKAELQLHIKKIHENDYMCQSCSMTFNTSKEYEFHSCLEKRQPQVNENDTDQLDCIIATAEDDCSNDSEMLVTYIVSPMEETHNDEISEVLGSVMTDPTNKISLQDSSVSKMPETSHLQGNIENYVLQDRKKPNLQPPFTCDICQKVFPRRWNLQQHLGTHDSAYQKYSCKLCNLSFSYHSSYKNHMMKHSNNQQTYECLTCSKTYRSKTSLSNHQKKAHEKVMKYMCAICSKNFFTKSEYNNHMRVHTRENPYLCSSCGKKFSHASHLHRHEKLHTGERPHKCHLCPKAFIQAVSLRMHLKKHEKESVGAAVHEEAPPSFVNLERVLMNCEVPAMLAFPDSEDDDVLRLSLESSFEKEVGEEAGQVILWKLADR